MGILERLRHYGIDNIVESNVQYALRAQASQGDPEAAFKLLMLLEDTYEGLVKPYDPDVRLIGAVNREAVTCYLDALLFAMFARLDSFEAMLYDIFEDAKRKRLAGLIRLWVNMLRTGRLITTDITKHLQEALADCGWADAIRLKQQDPSEAFTFITGQLELPMLTLKMDMHHAGKEDPQDDHKFVNERLLEVAILDRPMEGNAVITLEDCLEHYFNNRIEVKRHMENQRRNTLKSAQAFDNSRIEDASKVEKESGAHIEVAAVPLTPVTQSAVQTPFAETPSPWPKMASPAEMLRPSFGRKRQDSIFSQRKVQVLEGVELERSRTDASQDPAARKMSTRTEVLMPAWQFFKLLPWYAENMPTSEAQVAAHFANKRPVLGICLKRYSYTNTGEARRLDTYVDIPLEIAVPYFVSDEHLQDEGSLVGNFSLMLQSVVCHRGVSVHSGHYVCLSRGRAPNAQPSRTSVELSRDLSDDTEDAWLRFDDLAKERITYVDIHEALKRETPYLLFYQVCPIAEDGQSVSDLPSYSEATSRSQSDATPLEKPFLYKTESSGSGNVFSESRVPRSSIEVSDFALSSDRQSLDAVTALGIARGRPVNDTEPRRRSIAIDTSSISGSTTTDPTTNSVPTTPSEEKNVSLLSVAKLNSRRGSRVSKASGTSRSRGPSADTGTRFNLNMAKLTQKMSTRSDGVEEGPISQPSGTAATEAPGQKHLMHKISSDPVNDTYATNVMRESRPAAKARKDKEKGTLKKRGHRNDDKGGKQEDRDCVVM